MKLKRSTFSVIIRSLFFVFVLFFTCGSLYSAAAETYYFFVFSNPVAGHEDEYNKWYNEQHAPDVVAVPSFVTARRFVKNDLPLYRMVDLQVPKYLVLYKIVTSDVEAVFTEVNRRLQTGETVISPTFDRTTSVSYVYKPFRPEIKGAGGEPVGANRGSKQSYIQVVFTAMVEGKEDEFNLFYDNHHAPELAAIPGFVSAQRMILARPSNSSIPPTKYLALFRVETSDLNAVKQVASGPGFTSSPAFDTKATRGYTFRAIGPIIEGDKVRAAPREERSHREISMAVSTVWLRNSPQPAPSRYQVRPIRKDSKGHAGLHLGHCEGLPLSRARILPKVRVGLQPSIHHALARHVLA